MPALKPSLARWLSGAIGVIAFGLGVSVMAQETGSIPPGETSVDAARAELEVIQSSINLSEARAQKLRDEIAALEGDSAAQNAALIAAGQRVKLAEIEVNAAEERLSGLLSERDNIRARLDGAKSQTGGVLAALQRLGKTPPPAVLVSAGDALGSARSAGLMAAILPQLRDRSEIIASDLTRLETVREQARREEEELRTNLNGLFEEQLRIATLIEAKKRGRDRVTADLANEEAQTAALSGQAADLSERIKTLTAPTDPETFLNGAGQVDVEAVRVALARADRTAPAVPFETARGFLPLPAAGVRTSQFGGDDGFGGKSNGVSIVTRAEARVVAPADGWVMYKGPYLNYGQIVIINAGQGYSILLAGLDTTNVELGQFVMMGEPIGVMGTRTSGLALATSAGVARPTLYIELRHEDEPLNPDDWWAQQNTQNRSG